MPADITNYGAVKNPDDATISAAVENHQALKEAAQAAGQNGTVYIPEGTYYLGGDEGNMLKFGNREPAGVSFTGDGPEKSVIGPSTTHGDNNYWLFNYDNGYDHGTEVKFDNLKIDGQGRNLSLRPDYGRSGRLIVTASSTSNTQLTCQNVHLYDGYSNAIANAQGNWQMDIDRCTFERIAVKSIKEAGIGGHAIKGPQSGADTSYVTNSKFYRLARTIADFNDGGPDGTLVFNNCWAKGINLAWVKSGKDGRIEFNNCYYEAKTPWIDNLPRGNNRPESNGRHFIQNLTNTDGTLEIICNNVSVNEVHRHAVFDYTLDDSPSNVLFKGDQIAVDGMSRTTNSGYSSAFDDDKSGGGGIEFDVANMSVHNTGGGSDQIFNTPHGSGTIDTLYRDNNLGLGNLGNVSVNTDKPATSPLTPTVPVESDVGINSSGSGSDGGSGSEPVTSSKKEVVFSATFGSY